MSEQPEFFIFAGPNGSGKSSFLSEQLPSGVDFFNPDDMAHKIAMKKGLSGKEIQEAVYSDKRIQIAALKQLRAEIIKAFENKTSFATETALNNNTYKKVIQEARANGYKVHLWYVGTESAEINIKRVHSRVADNGHGVPENKIVERYKGSLSNLKRYASMADEVRIYDNSIDCFPPNPKLNLHVENKKIVYAAPDISQWVKDNVCLVEPIAPLVAAPPISETGGKVEERKELFITAREKGGRGASTTDATEGKTYTGRIVKVGEAYALQQSRVNDSMWFIHALKNIQNAVAVKASDTPVEISYDQNMNGIVRPVAEYRRSDRNHRR